MICFIDYRCTLEEINSLVNLGLHPIKVPKSSLVYEAINGHVDIQLNVLDKISKTIIIQKDISRNFIDILNKNNIKYVLSDNSLKNTYPGDIILNAAITDKYVIHNFKHTDKNLLKYTSNKKFINVNQGYSKCSILCIKNNVFITSDKGIQKRLIDEDCDVLYVPNGDIILKSMNYGFIGGCGGMINSNTLALFGELSHYKYGNLINNFLEKHHINIISLKKGKLTDRGSLFVL